jgi:hypothetical protein
MNAEAAGVEALHMSKVESEKFHGTGILTGHRDYRIVNRTTCKVHLRCLLQQAKDLIRLKDGKLRVAKHPFFDQLAGLSRRYSERRGQPCKSGVALHGGMGRYD